MEADFQISCDIALMDLDFVHQYLSESSYWAKGRDKELVKKSMENSLCFGLFQGKRQIGFGRVATDFVVFAWLMDFFIDQEFQGRGLGKYLINHILNHPDLQAINGIGLRTNDASEFYRKFGFDAIPNPDTWMFFKNK